MRVFTAAFTVVPATSCTDLWEFVPAPGYVNKIRRIVISGVQTTGSSMLFKLIKRSTAASGGTSTNAAIINQGEIDGASAAPNARVKVYTANPTVGTSIGVVREIRVPIPAPSTTILGIVYINFDIDGNEGLILQGNEFLCGNFNGVSMSGGSISVNIDFVEG